LNFDYITDFNNRLLTRALDFSPLTLRFDSGDELETMVTAQYELLENDFQIHPDQIIGRGSYTFDWYRVAFRSARRRNVWLGSSLRWGAFFSGRRRDVTLAAGYKVAVPLFLGAEYERNRVFLPDGRFTVNVSRLNGNVLFSPTVTLYSFVQYDNLTNSLGWQSRFYWILKPGNEIIVVWNSSWRDPFEYLQLTESATRFKVNYNYRF
jgi:hypothetical protein